MNNNYIKAMQTSSPLFSGSMDYVEELYEEYLHNPSSVPPQWQTYFNSLGQGTDTSHADLKAQFLALSAHSQGAVSGEGVASEKQFAVTELINAFRTLGHRAANIDPLNLLVKNDVPELTLAFHGLSDADLNTEFDVGNIASMRKANLKTICETLKQIYCGNIGAEIMHITDTKQRQWLLQRFEENKGKFPFSVDDKKRLLKKIAATEGLEKYLGTKYPGQKRFSIEGADAMIPMMDTLALHSSKNGAKEMLVGMAHRGRLNMLVNFLGKAPVDLFSEFEGKKIEGDRSGDVKYHKGFSSDMKTPYGFMHLAMAYNPSHLEIINPVIEGSVRAKQWRSGDAERQEVLPVLIHGDAAFSSQGIVQETFNMSQVPGYTTGGTIHLIVNNQVGFTTSAQEGRSTLYCSDIAKMVEAPIFHVNGDDVEACAFATQLLYDFRKQFKKDIVLDLVCYRRYGHQETDEPSATQPVMYQVIKQHLTPYKLYSQQLIAENVMTEEEINQVFADYRASLDSGKPVVEVTDTPEYKFSVNWKEYNVTDWRTPTKTAVDKKTLMDIGQKLSHMPAGFKMQPQVEKAIEARRKMMAGETPMDWGTAETLAYATLLTEGFPIRLSGEDIQRGTFSHRHAVLNHYETGEKYMPLSTVSKTPIWIINSILSEAGVMGFEVGYTAVAPDQLVVWEAQYGDFANGAQVIVDQFLSSGEQKWAQQSGLVLLLPHGYEGGGPEHSSARLERYLQLCAQNNLQVIMPTTPAQIFHVLRRQMLRKMRTPLIVMSPKSVLRAPLAISSLDDLSNGQFLPVISEIDDIKADAVERVILCSGKVYYDLLTQRRESKLNNIAIVRVEQLYPFPTDELKAILLGYKKASSVIWCQEEPLNQGTWYSMQHNMVDALATNQTLKCVARPAMAAPSTGYMSVHLEQQKKLVNEALRFS